MKRDLKEIIVRARQSGWRVEPTGGGHLRFCPPPATRAPCVFTGSTPSDRRAIDNLKATLRRAGLDTKPHTRSKASRPPPPPKPPKR